MTRAQQKNCTGLIQLYAYTHSAHSYHSRLEDGRRCRGSSPVGPHSYFVLRTEYGVYGALTIIMVYTEAQACHDINRPRSESNHIVSRCIQSTQCTVHSTQGAYTESTCIENIVQRALCRVESYVHLVRGERQCGTETDDTSSPKNRYSATVRGQRGCGFVDVWNKAGLADE